MLIVEFVALSLFWGSFRFY